jgi:hypothetical protein
MSDDPDYRWTSDAERAKAEYGMWILIYWLVTPPDGSHVAADHVIFKNEAACTSVASALYAEAKRSKGPLFDIICVLARDPLAAKPRRCGAAALTRGSSVAVSSNIPRPVWITRLPFSKLVAVIMS